MTIYASPFMVFIAAFWAATARAEQSTGKWDKRLWAVTQFGLAVAMVLALTGHAHWSRA